MSHSVFTRALARALLVSFAAPCFLVPFPLPAHADDVVPAVFIEEVAWSGSSASTSDEWIELANLGSATTSVAGWSLRGAGSSQIFFPDGAEIGPSETYRIANYAETDEKSALAVIVHIATTTVSLSNSALGIELLDSSGVVVDRAGNGQVPLAGSSSPHITMIRAATSSGDIANAWMSAPVSIGFKTTSTTDLGAPGICALCIAIPVIAPPPEQEQEITPVATSTDPLPPVEETTSTPAIPNPPPPPPPPLHFSLSEAMSNPADGPEWVELKITETQATSTDRALELWDKSSRFMTIPAHTAITAPGYLVLSLVSARLNNGGDDLSIREVPLNGSSGIVIDLIHIPALEDGVAWAKRDDGTWSETETLTPGGSNQFSASIIVTPKATVTSTTSPPVTQTTATTYATTTPTIIGPPLTIMLNEAMSNPDGGKEWVELRIAETDATTTHRAYELWDASGRMVTIPTGTVITSPGYLLVPLPTARLNNGGDALSLREAGGDITLDATDIPALAKGIAWARDETSLWTDTDTPTPGTVNHTDSTKNNNESPENKGEDNEPSSETIETKTSSITSASMSDDSPINARVRLVGTVGSVPRLLGATHAFILLGEDGRAAITYLPKHLHTPTFGSTVRVMGTLTATERQLELRMKTSDVWMTVSTSTPPNARTVDFLAPAAEDAWGLVAVTGTVKMVGTTSFVMDVDAIDVTVSAPSATKYRTKRLTVGDVVHVIGLLDPRKESPTILIRVPEDIALTAHAPESVTPPSSSSHTSDKQGLPDWTPFGAAAGAVAATGGFQRIRTLLKRRKLEALAATHSS
jgi:hypothetical protein